MKTLREDYLKASEKLKNFILNYLETHSTLLPGTSEEIINRLKQYATAGKLMRGSLVILSAELFGAGDENAALKLAAAIELLHSGVLIIDDIIDRDELRRGQQTFHRFFYDRYAAQMNNRSVTGEDFAMCAGLLSSYLGYTLLDGAPEGAVKLVSEAYAITSLAEVLELKVTLKSEFSEEDVLKVYELKTGVYSIGLPLASGALLAGRKDLFPAIESSSKPAGIAFQIKDDLIEIHEPEEVTGKSRFSDLYAGRKTLAVSLAFKSADKESRKFLKDVFARGGIRTQAELQTILQIFKNLQIEEKLHQLLVAYSEEALELAGKDTALRSIVEWLVKFNLERKS